MPYYVQINADKVIHIKEKAPRTLYGKVGNNPSGTRNFLVKKQVPDIQFLVSVPFPDVLTKMKDVKLYLRAKGYPEKGLRISKTYEFKYMKPLDIAVKKGNIKLIRKLIDSGADISASNWVEKPVAVRRDDDIYPLLTLKQKNWSSLDQIIIKDNVQNFKTFLTGSKLNKKQLTQVINSLLLHQSPKILKEINEMHEFDFIYNQQKYLIKAYQTGNPMVLKFMLNGGANFNSVVDLRKLSKSFVYWFRYYKKFDDKDFKESIGSIMIAHALKK